MEKVQYFIGIDLHKTVVQVCVLNKAGEVDEEFRMRLGETDTGTEIGGQNQPIGSVGGPMEFTQAEAE